MGHSAGFLVVFFRVLCGLISSMFTEAEPDQACLDAKSKFSILLCSA